MSDREAKLTFWTDTVVSWIMLSAWDVMTPVSQRFLAFHHLNVLTDSNSILRLQRNAAQRKAVYVKNIWLLRWMRGLAAIDRVEVFRPSNRLTSPKFEPSAGSRGHGPAPREAGRRAPSASTNVLSMLEHCLQS